MDGGRDPGEIRRFVGATRRGTLATVDSAGQPRLVPLCFALEEAAAAGASAPLADPAASPDQLILYSALDEKPKRSADPLALARVRDLLARPNASVLVDRWSEDWSRLAWVRLACRGELVGPDGPRAGEHRQAVAALRAKYPQYRSQHLEDRPVIRLTCTIAATWGDLSPH